MDLMKMLSVFLNFLAITALLIWKAAADNGYFYQPHIISHTYYQSAPILPTVQTQITPPSYQTPPSYRTPPSPIVTPKEATNFKFFNSLNLNVPLIENNYLSQASYTIGGRVLKQYLVQEDVIDDILPPPDFTTSPLVFSDFTNLYDKYAGINQQQNFIRIQVSKGPASVIQPVTRNHGPVALGSGSLGYIRRPNGGIFLGSGSLGYISGQDRVNDVNQARAPKGAQPGPTSFGDSAINLII